jgi:hypothetical protein
LVLGFLELPSVILRGKRRFCSVFELYIARNLPSPTRTTPS